MKTRNRRKGRPPKFVLDPNGRPIVGLSYNKANKSYYATYSNPRVWFGSDLAEALFKFRKYENDHMLEEPVVQIHLPYLPGPNKNGIVEWSDVCKDIPLIGASYPGETAAIPENLFLEAAREIILRDPIDAARKLGIPELARLTDLPPLDPPLSLESILQFYLDHRKPSGEESKKMKSAWTEFCGIVKMHTVREISSDMIHDYHDIIWAEHEKGGWKNSWLKARCSRVKTLLKYSFENGRTNKRELKTVLDFCKCLKVPTTVEEDAKPIDRGQVHQLLSHCDTKWRAIILLALNCGYYAKDIHDLKKSMIRDRNGIDHIVFPREKNKHKRVNVLWPETKEALDGYVVKKKHNSDYVFTSQLGTPYAPHDVQRCFGRLREKAGIPDDVKFCHFRDGAASTLFGKVESDMLKVTIGHRIKGEKSKYISVKPEQVKVCADVIYAEYFG